MAKKRNIEMFFWDGIITVAPSVINLADAFAEKGHAVTIYTPTDLECAPNFSVHANVRIVELKGRPAAGKVEIQSTETKAGVPSLPYRIYTSSYGITRKLLSFIPFLTRKNKERFKLNAITRYYNLIIKRKRKASSNGYLLIGIDAVGLYWANTIRNKADLLFYLSLELSLPPKFHTTEFLEFIEEAEKRIHRNKVSQTLIQDVYRTEVLKKKHDIVSNEAFSILTNSPRSMQRVHSGRENFFEKNFSLPHGSFKILSAGMIAEEVLSSDVAREFKKFSDKGIYMIFHERWKQDPRQEYLQTIQHLGGPNLVLSLNPVSYDAIGEIFESADIGLVFYNKDFGENFSNIVGASGKLTHYLKYGIPIICLDLPGFPELVAQYGCGVVITDMSKLEAAVDTIRANYTAMKRGAEKCYAERYDFDKQFEVIYEKFKDRL